jgi:hypothetical protein
MDRGDGRNKRKDKKHEKKKHPYKKGGWARTLNFADKEKNA